MRNDLTDLTVVLDRSGSMGSIRSDAEGGLNAFVDKQKAEKGSCTFTLIQFDDTAEFVYKAVDLKSVLQIPLVPRGSTALLDAIGMGIASTGERLKNMTEDQRPGLVVFVILTDGQENASHEYTKARIAEMIQHQRDVYKWQFTFLGANQDAFASAAGMNMDPNAALNYKEEKTSGAFRVASNNVGRMREMAFAGMPVSNSYTQEEIDSVK